MNYECIGEIKTYYSRKKSDKKTHFRGMDKFLNLKDDDEDEDEEKAARVIIEVTVREGDSARQGTEARVVDQTTEVSSAKASIGVTTRCVTHKRLQVSDVGPSKEHKKKKSRSTPALLAAIHNELVLEIADQCKNQYP